MNIPCICNVRCLSHHVNDHNGTFSSFIMRFSSLFCIHWILYYRRNFNCCCWKYVSYLPTIANFICCHTYWWLGITCWRPGFPRKRWMIVRTYWCNVYLIFYSGIIINGKFILVCLSWIFGPVIYIHDNIICVGVYFTRDLDFFYVLDLVWN